MTTTPPPTPPSPLEPRLTAVEEHTAFTERTVEHLSAEIAELNKRLHALTARLASLEDTLRRAQQQPATPTPPQTPASEAPAI